MVRAPSRIIASVRRGAARGPVIYCPPEGRDPLAMAPYPPPPRHRRAAGRSCAAAVCLAVVAATAVGAGPAPVATAVRPTAEQARDAARPEAQTFAERVTAAWNARDLDAWLALWRFATPAERTEEEALARDAFAADETKLTLLRQPGVAATATRFTIEAQVFVAAEPRGRVAYWRLRAEKRDGQWALVERQDAGQLDGLVHLSLGPAGVPRPRRLAQARGLRAAHGERHPLPDLGRRRPDRPRLRGPRPCRLQPGAAVRERAAAPVLGCPDARRGGGVGVRARAPGRLPALRRHARASSPSPWPPRALRRAEAERLFRARAPRSFALDADLPRSPWWLLPGVGDAIVDFPQGRRVLTFAVSSGESEDLNLFDRDRQLQICVYPSAGRPLQYDDDARRSSDVLEQDLTVRFEPDRLTLAGVHRMKLVQLQPSPTIRLRLDDDFRVVLRHDGGRDEPPLLPRARAEQHRGLARLARRAAASRSPS